MTNLFLIIFCATNGLVGIVYFLPKFLINSLQKLNDNIIFSFESRPNKKEIVLTIDDVPYGSEDRIIKILNKYNVKGNFFFISDFLTGETKENMISLIKDGHEVYNHGSTDSMHFKYERNMLYKEIDQCSNTLFNLYNESNVTMPEQVKKYYRPGSGFVNREMLRLVKDQDMKIVLGSVYPHDPQVPIPFINYNYIKYKIEPGDIIILHDRSWTIPLLEKLVPYLIKEGFTFISLSNINKFVTR